jgi:hypothetical protein
VFTYKIFPPFNAKDFFGFAFFVFQRNTLWVKIDPGDSWRSARTHCASIEIDYFTKDLIGCFPAYADCASA